MSPYFFFFLLFSAALAETAQTRTVSHMAGGIAAKSRHEPGADRLLNLWPTGFFFLSLKTAVHGALFLWAAGKKWGGRKKSIQEAVWDASGRPNYRPVCKLCPQPPPQALKWECGVKQSKPVLFIPRYFSSPSTLSSFQSFLHFLNLFIFLFGWSYKNGPTSIILQENTSVAFNPARDQD